MDLAPAGSSSLKNESVLAVQLSRRVLDDSRRSVRQARELAKLLITA